MVHRTEKNMECSQTWTLSVQVEKILFTFELIELRTLLRVRKLDKIRKNEIRKRVGSLGQTAWTCV